MDWLNTYHGYSTSIHLNGRVEELLWNEITSIHLKVKIFKEEIYISGCISSLCVKGIRCI